jgi:bacterioferritin (cytochrome b1)
MIHPTPWISFLDEILSSDSKHYLWLKTLSYLEYIGYRKMVKAIPYTAVDQEVFHHLSDEIQHSFMLKELAHQSFGGQNFSEEALKQFADIAETYFQGIDSHIHDWVLKNTGEDNPFLSYMWVSYIIEKRAMKVYPQYFAKLTQSSLKIVLQKIIKDESQHLSYLEKMIQHFPSFGSLKENPLFDFEETCFINFLKNLRQSFQEANL